MTSRVTTITGSSLLVLFVVMGLSACSKPAADDSSTSTGPAVSASETERTIRVQTELIQPTTFTETVTVTGSLVASDDAVLSARSSGTIVSLLSLGRSVNKGATIASIDPGLANASVQQAEASLNSAKAQYELAEDAFQRQEPLYRDSVISPIEFQQVRTQMVQAAAQVNAAEATLKQVQEQLAYTQVTAPFPGRVEAHLVETGEQVAPGTPVVRLVNAYRIKVVAGIPERYAGEISQGATVTVSLASYGLPNRQGTVTFVGSAIDAGSRTFPIEIDLTNTDGKLKPEMIATIDVTRQTIDDAIVIRQSAILHDELGSSVYIVDRSSGKAKAARRTVQVGASGSGRVVITEGLAAGDELIIVGQSNVAPGDALTIDSSALSQATN